jgi:putative flippase GtrA
VVTEPDPRPDRPAGWRRFIRYALGSGAATLVSAVAFALVYRLLHLGPRVATGSAFLGGALVNFTASRFWAWGRRARFGLGRDALGYALLAVGTASLAAATTSVVDRLLRDAEATRRAVLVEAAYFATYGALFLVKFVLLDRVLFRSRHQVPSTTRA